MISVFDIVLISLVAILVILVIILLVKNYAKKEDPISPQIQELKKELEDMKTKQLESQNKALLDQQQLFQTKLRYLVNTKFLQV